MKIVDMFDVILSTLISFFVFVFGGFTEVMTLLLVLNTIDIITGVMTGVKMRNLASKRMTEGLFKKFGMWCCIIIGHVLDVVVFNHQPVAKNMVVTYFIGNEGLSILENVGKLGLIAPKKLFKYLEQLKDKIETEDKK